jgi:two-component system phosphate regulon response regulator PhoB
MTHRILIVEDEPSIAELIAVNLSHAGYEVEKALQADIAFNMMKEQLPSLVIFRIGCFLENQACSLQKS